MKRHPFDVLSFTAGAVFVGLGIAFLAAGDDVVDNAHWIWPVVLVALGVAGLVSALRRTEDADEDEAA